MKDVAQNTCDLKRLTKSKESVDLAPNTIRAFAKRGLKLYRSGRAVFFSQSELVDFIRREAA
jgi:hypothetical protein